MSGWRISTGNPDMERSLSASRMRIAVVAYIRDQARHHQNMTFLDEYRRLLKRYHVEFDERYVWD